MRIIATIIIVVGLFGCNTNSSNTNENSHYCDNEISLISTFDTIPKVNNTLFDIRDNFEVIVRNHFDSIYCCKDVRLNVIHAIDSIDNVWLSVNYYYGCDGCHTCNYQRLVTLLNKKGQVLFGPDIIPLDSLEHRIYEYYSSIGEQGFPETYKNVHISLQWDKFVSNILFSKYVEKIISGYLKFLNERCKAQYNNKLCRLKIIELKQLSKNIPFNLHIDKVYEITEESRLVENYGP